MQFLHFAKRTIQKRSVHAHAINSTEEAIKTLKTSKTEAIALSVLCFVICPIWSYYLEKPENAKKLILYDQDHLPSWIGIRAKPFGWTCYNCGLLDGPCQKECKKENAKKKELFEKYQSKLKHAEATKL